MARGYGQQPTSNSTCGAATQTASDGKGAVLQADSGKENGGNIYVTPNFTAGD
jgi:hypothetical protein